jgi:HlyD family secretion protein
MKKNRKIIYILVFIALMAALLVWAFSPRAVPVEMAKASEGHFELSVEEYGKTRVRERYTVSAPLAASVARISLREGDSIQAGAVLASLTPVLSPMLDARTLQEQTARVETADAMVSLANARIERARVALQQASVERSRSEKLVLDRFVSASKLEMDRLAELAAKKELDSANEERHVATHELQQARAALHAVQKPSSSSNKSVFTLQSPVTGSVLRLLQKSESTVALGTPLLEIGDTRNMEIVAELLTTDALQATPGTPLEIARWGGKGILAGRVRRVEPAAFTKISALGVEEQRVNVLIDITSPYEQWKALGDGFRVNVRIITLSKKNVLRVPVSAVFPDINNSEANAMAAFLVIDGKAKLVSVKVAARNGVDAWITAGLNPGDQIIVYPGNAVKNGVRVVARKTE